MPSLFDLGFGMTPSLTNLHRAPMPMQAPGLMAPMPQPQPHPQQTQTSPMGGLLGGLEQGMSSPLFQAGIGLAAGGLPGLSQGLQTGQKMRERQEMLPLERRIKEAQAGLYEAKASGKIGSEAPSNVREWQYFSRLTPEQQQQYLTMKRAERYLDTETGFVRPNPVTGEVAPVVSKDVAGAAQQKKSGEMVGQAQAQLPSALAAGDRLISGIDALLEDSALSRVTGPWQGRMPNVTAGAARAQSRIDQIQGATFLQAFNDLRGGGQITEQEGAKATAAYNRLMTQTMGDSDYRAALGEFKGEVRKLMNIARQRAGQAPAGVAPPNAGGDAGGWSAREIN